MARTQQQIFDEMKAEGIRLATEQNDQKALDMFNNISNFARWRRFFMTIAFCVWSLEKLWDNFKAVVLAIVAAQTAHTLQWYRTKALAFQYGYDLISEKDIYDNTGLTVQEIEDSKVVRYAAVNETNIDGKRVLLVKVAGVDADGNLVQLTDLQETAFIAYMERIKDAGNVLLVYNRAADILKAEIEVYYNPLLLDDQGNRLDGTAGKPIEAAALAYLQLLPFNGEFSNAAFIDAVQGAYGVADNNVFLRSMQRKIGANNYQAVANTFIPDAGYTKFDVDGLTIIYTAHV